MRLVILFGLLLLNEAHCQTDYFEGSGDGDGDGDGSGSTTTTTAAPFYVDHQQYLLSGLSNIDTRDREPSKVYMFGKTAFPVLCNQADSCNVAAATYGKGRVLVIGAAHWPLMGTTTMKEFGKNALRWLSKKSDIHLISLAYRYTFSLSQYGVTVNSFHNYVTPSKLQSIGPDVYWFDFNYSMNDNEIKDIVNYVENGGGLIISYHAWYWFRYTRRQNTALTYANGLDRNRLVSHFGLLIGDYDDARSWSPARERSISKNIYFALNDIVQKGTTNEIGMQTICNGTEILLNNATSSMDQFTDLWSLAIKAFDKITFNNSTKKVYGILSRAITPVLMENEICDLRPAKDAGVFPGHVESKARHTVSIRLTAVYSGKHQQFSMSDPFGPELISTGLYAAPGEIITVRINQNIAAARLAEKNLFVQIGAHHIETYEYNYVKRSPSIVYKTEIKANRTLAMGPWGGPIYIGVYKGQNFGLLNLKIENCVLAPYFKLGQHFNQQWMSSIKNYPAPWAELEVPNDLILTLPSAVVRDLTNPQSVAVKYAAVMKEYNWLSGIDTRRGRPVRIVVDVKLPPALDAITGYPLVYDGYDNAYSLVDITKPISKTILDKITSVHLMYTMTHASTKEFRDSFVMLYYSRIYQKVFNISTVDSRVQFNTITHWVMTGKKQNIANIMFHTFHILFEEIGWQAFREANQYFLSAFQGPRNQDYTTNLLIQKLCLYAKFNLASYFAWWGHNIHSTTRSQCARYPNLNHSLTDRFNPVDHGICDDGWVPYGKSCFFFSSEKMTWSNAEEACNQVGIDVNLASCFSSEESFFISSFLKNSTTGSNDTYFIGVETMHKDQRPRFLDGSSATKVLMPWDKKNNGLSDPANECGAYSNTFLVDTKCNNFNKYICKKGPTSCKPVWCCPRGWKRRHDRCYKVSTNAVGFQAAEQSCNAQDSSLVEFQSKEEHDFVVSMSGGNSFWIGINNYNNETWISGQDIVFSRICDEDIPEGETYVFVDMNQGCWKVSATAAFIATYVCETAAKLF